MIVKIKSNVKDKTNNVKRGYSKVKKSIISFFKEKGKMNKIKLFFKYLWKWCLSHKVLNILLMAVPFIIIDVSTRIFGNAISFFGLFNLVPRLFSIIYIILFLGISLNIKNKHGKILYSILFIISFVLYLVQNVYYSSMNTFFSFSLMALAGEGMDYAWNTILKCNIWVYVVALLIIFTYIMALRKFPKRTSYNKKRIIKVSVLFLILHFITKLMLGNGNFELTWDSWRNPRNVYNNFNDANKCLALTGFYEYSLRDFYITYIKPSEKKSETESNFLDEVFSSKNDSFHKNKYTGKFKNKNVILVQMEGLDNWLFTKELMPNLYSLLDNSINFTNHYSFYNGGGSTFNSEFSVNTGYVAPFTYPANAYTMNKNVFPYTLANLMRNENYSVRAFHMNNREYYSRGINYSNWGYDQYFGLEDTGGYTDNTYYLDRELINNPKFYEKLFHSTGKFVNSIITYSNHVPFNTESGVCRKLLEIDYKDEMENMTSAEKTEFLANLNMGEEDCIKRQVKETDYMIGLLLQALKDNGLYNNTVILFYADHYLFTASDEVISQYKDKSNNLVNHTPFLIWSAGMKKENVTKVTTQLNILPTLLNLLGVEYNEKWYMMSDALDSKYTPLAIFPDMSWYDGTNYVVDGIIANNKKINELSLDEKNNLVEYLIKKNDLVLKYDYFNEIMRSEDRLWKK